MDLRTTDLRFWDQYWDSAGQPSVINRHIPIFWLIDRRLRRFVREGVYRTLELGCVNGKWMAHMAHRYGHEVAGIDFSEAGLRVTEANLARLGVNAQLWHGDILDADPIAPAHFDYVFSLGLVEHFTDTIAPLAAHARYCRPGGRVIVAVPSFYGILGRVGKWADPVNYAVHVPLTVSALKAAVLAIPRLRLVTIEHFGGIDLAPSHVYHRLPRYVRPIGRAANQMFCLIPTRGDYWTSYIFLVCDRVE